MTNNEKEMEKMEEKPDSAQKPPAYERPMEIHHHYYYEPPPPPVKGKSSKPSIAGALLLITAILGIVGGMALLSFGFVFGDMEEGFTFFGQEQNGDITGTVVAKNGTPIAGVNISIVGEPLSTKTDSDGNYILCNVPSGNRKIMVEKEGYITIIYKTFIDPSRHSRDKEEDFSNEYSFTMDTGSGVVEKGSYPPWDLIRSVTIVCGVLIVLFSIIALIGALQAFRRTGWGIAMTGAILGLFTILGTLFALIAIFILVLSKNEFNGSSQYNPPHEPRRG
ncbi:MAG: carboxypeptidase regulatory-like domain-containing protein [Thermoplasmata archaeon]|nr:MAG: carboxypeptidase regulatory-like domain-containing protein [Thermoplasmata archaeon]